MSKLNPFTLIGKQVKITDTQSPYFNHWGIIISYDGDYYHVSNGSISSSFGEIAPIFDREQFKISRNHSKHEH